MKKFTYTLLLLCAFTFCFAQEKTTYTNEHGEKHLCGPFDFMFSKKIRSMRRGTPNNMTNLTWRTQTFHGRIT